MDGALNDHSDSDSGESWTLLEHTPSSEDAPGSPDNSLLEPRKATPNVEKDEDTDGISIISDSDPEPSTACELSYNCKEYLDENSPMEHQTCQFISVSPIQSNINHNHECIQRDDDLLVDNNGKHKTYVHRRNKRLSTVLNIIMLGSVITAAGVAIGHMWGARYDCSLHPTPSVNKILSNLYKLQEENAYLRNKLKELTIANILVQHKPVSESVSLKHQRCRKVYEGSINNKNADKATKCLDNKVDQIMNVPLIQPEYEKDFLHDIDKLRHVYQQNKSWLDLEIAKRIKREVNNLKPTEKNIKNTNLNKVEDNLKEGSIKKPLETTVRAGIIENIEKEFELLKNPSEDNVTSESKVSYADSLKTDKFKNIPNDNIKVNSKKVMKNTNTNKNRKGEKGDTMPEIALSEHEFKKDDRYMVPKPKKEIKKHDRQKSHKKQKRKNKYEQWEMKGGYLREYDEFSTTSSQENEYTFKNPNNDIVDYDNNVKKLDDNEFENSSKHKNCKTHINKDNDHNKKMDSAWYDKRTALRYEARKKLEQELFGESTPNKARWYFRRVKKREQCRAKGNDSSYKKKSKQEMNYKMKH